MKYQKYSIIFQIFIAVCVILVAQVHVANAATYTVTTNADSGAGTLRQAIIDANANAGTDTINFDATTMSGATITLSSELDALTGVTIIDGTTLTDVQTGPDITIVGYGPATAVINFNNTGTGNIIKGVALKSSVNCVYASGTTGLTIGGSTAGQGNWFDNCSFNGINLQSDANTTILGNTIGGTTGNGNGINTLGSSSLTIGGTGADDKNIVVSSILHGIIMTNTTTASILGNWIGTKNGTTAAANGGWGIYVAGTGSNITIGGTASGSRNVVSGNGGGIIIFEDNVTGTSILGNYIGVSSAGSAALSNNNAGIYTNSAITIGGTATGAGNVISGNSENQIYLADAGATASVANSTGSTIQGNYIGINAAGTAAIVGNNVRGILIYNSNNTIGGTSSSARNIISGNSWEGILIVENAWRVTGNVIQGNYIGTNAAGTAAIANGGPGVSVSTNADNTTIGGTAAGAGNLISGNTQQGILFSSNTGGIVETNVIGLNAAGNGMIGNGFSGVQVESSTNVMIGGTTSASRNIASGNETGIAVTGSSSNITIKQNYVGTNAAGTVDYGNTLDGIYIDGTVSNVTIGAASQGNLISGNTRAGIFNGAVGTSAITVRGNTIGLDVNGADLGNDSHGILLAGSNNVIGGTGAGDENIVSGNGEYGIIVAGPGGTTVKGNIVGTNVAGTSAIANTSGGIYISDSSNNTIGGTTAEDRNIISGNGGYGVFICCSTGSNNVVQGNYIGTNASGAAAVANGAAGVQISGAVAITNNTIGGSASGTGNLISGNTGRGVLIDGGATNTVAGNTIGLNLAGTAAIANGSVGVELRSNSNIVGGTDTGSRNYISGNTASGVGMYGTATGNTVENNYIGTNAAGTAAIANGDAAGIHISESAYSNFIGVAGFGNVISGNTGRGVWIQGQTSNFNSIQGNIIGLVAAGTTALGNGAAGILVSGGTGNIIGTINVANARNVIASSATEPGVYLTTSSYTTFVNNYVGLAADGTTLRKNSTHGIFINGGSSYNTIGGIATGAGNQIAVNNTYNCLYIDGSGGPFNSMRGNTCMSESATVMNILREGTSNESVGTPVVTGGGSTTTSLVQGTTTVSNGNIDIYVDGVYAGSTTAVGTAWSKALAIASGGKVSAAVTNSTNSTSATTTPQVTVTNDVTDPTVSTLSPTDGATGVSPTANLVLTFSEAVDAESGNIVIKKTLDNSIFETIAVTDDPKVSGSGTTTITVNPATTLGSLAGYYVQIDATAFDDLSSNSYAGITNTTSWNFTTSGTAGVTASAISGATTEAAGTATFTVVLDTQPTNNVTVPITSSDTTEGTVSPSSLIFTSANWDTPQTITLTGVNDDVDDGNISYSAVLGSTTSDDSNYSGVNPADVSVTNTDNDTAGITVSAITGNTTEAAGTATFTVKLNTEPTANVTIPLFSSDVTEGTVSPSSLTFTSVNWASNQTVTVTGVHDSILDGNIAYSILLISASSTDLTYDNINPSDVSVTNTDDDAIGFTVSSISGDTTEAAGTATFTVKLNTEPTADVTISVSSSNTAEGTVSPSSLTFTSIDWGNKTVTVTGVDDDSIDGDVDYSIILGTSTSSDSNYNNINPSDVSVTNTDDDNVTVVSVTSSVTTSGGGSGGSGGSSGSRSSDNNDSDTASDSSDTDSDSAATDSNSAAADSDSAAATETNTDSDTGNDSNSETENDLGFTTPNHWSGDYLTNLVQDNHVMEIAMQESTFLSILTEMFTQPDKGINRGEALEFLIVLSEIDIGTVQIDTNSPAFTDVSIDYPRATYIEFASKANLVNGYPDGSFKPDQTLNRVEALKMTLQFFGFSIDTSLRGAELLNAYNLSENPFNDVDLDAWYAPYIIFEYSYGVVHGYGDGSFGPANPVTYAELLKIATLSQNIQQ